MCCIEWVIEFMKSSIQHIVSCASSVLPLHIASFLFSLFCSNNSNPNQQYQFYLRNNTTVVNLHSEGGSTAMVMASIWTGAVHLLLGVLGTFVLKRFPTSFSVGFFLGVLVILANQNLLLFGTFLGYSHGYAPTNHTFANLGMTLFFVLAFFATLLFQFKRHVVILATGTTATTTTSSTNNAKQPGDSSSVEIP